MSTVLIILILVIALVIGASFALGRKTYEVDSAKDTEFLELEGDWVRYNVMGGGPPVVLVHGWLSSSTVWEQLASRLAQRFTVYTLDLTGFGESDKPISGYGVRYGSRLLYAFCAHFGLAKVSIIGHDLGGDMAIKLASDHPDVVGRVVLVATPANEEQIDLPTPLWAATLPVIGPAFYALGRAARPVRNMWMTPFVSEPSDVTEEMLEDAASSTPAAMSQTLTVSRREIGGGRLARQARIIKVPALVVAGEEDQIVDPQAAGEWARSLGSAEVCLMDECGHMPMIERPGEFNAQILAFLTGDARYLEYADQRPAEAPPAPGTDVEDEYPDYAEVEDDSTDRDFSSEEMETGGDTRKFHIRPGEGEAPAFGAAPGDSDSGSVWSPSGREDAPKDERERGLREELEDTGGIFGEAARSRSREPRRGSEPGRTGDFGSPGDGERRQRIDRSRYEERNDPGDDEGDDHDFREKFSGRSGRSPGETGRRMTFGSPDDEDVSEPREAQPSEPRSQESRGAEDTSGRDEAFPAREEPLEGSGSESEYPHDQPRPRVRRRTHPEDAGGPGSFGTSGGGEESPPPSEDPEPGESGEQPSGEADLFPEETQPSRPRRRPRRERGDRAAGGVPEVPPGLFDWGDSLDVFQPPARDKGRGAPEPRDRREDAPEDRDEDSSDEPRDR